MTFDIGLHEVCVRVGVRYVITKFSWIDSLPNFLTHGAPQARASRARELRYQCPFFGRATLLAEVTIRGSFLHSWRNRSLRLLS